MPRPVYIICARGVIEDKPTNLVSVFSIMETLTITVVQTPPEGVNEPLIPSKQTVLAVWMKEDGDEAADLEHQFRVHLPDRIDDTEITPFSFESDKDLCRFQLVMGALPAPRSNCLIEFESRVRRPAGDWLSQRYPLRITFQSAEEPQPHG